MRPSLARLAGLAALAGGLLPVVPCAGPATAAPVWYAGELRALVAGLGPIAQSGASADPTGAERGNAESRVAALVIAAVAEDPADYARILGQAGAAAPGLRPGVEAAVERAYPAFAHIVPVAYTSEPAAAAAAPAATASVAPAALPEPPAEEDFEAASDDLAFQDVLPPPDEDPFEDVNRIVFAVGDAVDTILLKPLASFYGFVVPGPVKEGMRRVVDNLGSPADFANDLMQGKFRQGANTAGRFVINSTIGLAGFFDVAQGWGMPPHKNDFGITLATYGAGPGPYVVMPIWGPSTTRDAVGEVVDTALDPLTWLVGGVFGTVISSGKGVVQREEVIEELDQLRYGSLDYYVAVRSSLLQHRAAEVAAELGTTMVADGGEPAQAPASAAADDAFESFE